MDITEAVTGRRSVRAFTDEPVDLTAIERVLEQAQRAASGGNVQPWHVAVLTGDALQALRTKVGERLAAGEPPPSPEYPVYPGSLWEPYRSRRFQNGEQLYATLGIAREDKAGRMTSFVRNWDFFGAPVGLLLFVDRGMNHPQWADLGIWLQTVMLLLRAEGLESCAQEAWSAQHDLVAQVVDVPDQLMLFCGLAIGHEDTSAPVNTLRTTRAPLDEVVTWLDEPGPLTSRTT